MKNFYQFNFFAPKNPSSSQNKYYYLSRDNTLDLSSLSTLTDDERTDKNGRSFSSSSDFYQLLCMGWNTNGSTLCGGFNNEVKIWKLHNMGLKELQKRDINSFELKIIKSSNQNVFGGISEDSVRFWDIRQGSKQQLFCLNSQNPDEEWSVFDIHHSSYKFTVGSEQTIYCYDFRKQKRGTLLNTYKSQLPIDCVKWHQFSNRLITSGGMHGRGMIGLYDQNLKQLLQLQLWSTQIQHFTFNESSNILAALTEDNAIAIFGLPQFINQSVIDVPEQNKLYDLGLSASSKYVTVTSSKQILMYMLNNYNQQQYNKIQIMKYSPHIWHPTQDILCYIAQKDTNNLTLTVTKF